MTTVTVQDEVKEPALIAALAVLERSKSIRITNAAESASAQEFGLEISRCIKNAEVLLQPPVDSASENLDKARAHRDKYLVPMRLALKTMKDMIGTYLADERRKAEEARRAAEQKALEEQLARQRAAAEAEAAKAATLAAAGLHEEANAAMDEAVAIEQAAPARVYVPAGPSTKAKGVGLGEDYDFEVLDEEKIPREYFMRDDVKIRRVVKALKGSCSIPGIRVFPKPRVSLRG